MAAEASARTRASSGAVRGPVPAGPCVAHLPQPPVPRPHEATGSLLRFTVHRGVEADATMSCSWSALTGAGALRGVVQGVERRRFERRSLLVSESRGKRLARFAGRWRERRNGHRRHGGRKCERRSAVDADRSAPGGIFRGASSSREKGPETSPRFPLGSCPSSPRAGAALAQLERRERTAR